MPSKSIRVPPASRGTVASASIWKGVWLLLILLVLLPALAAGDAGGEATTPRIELDDEHRLILTGLPPILTGEGVKEHLTTGLTTSVAFRPGGNLPGGGRIDIRYDLWDEVFHVAAAGLGERIERATPSSFAALVEWWQGLRLVIAHGDRFERPWPRRLKVKADVVPFSAAEQDDARRWFSESIEEGRRSGTGEVGRSGDESTETLSRTFNLLLATSIRRRPLASFSWNLPLPPETSGPTGRAP